MYTYNFLFTKTEPPSPPYLEVFGRRLDPSNLFLPVKEGSELKLSCKSEGGRPLATLHWDPAPSELYLLDEQNQGCSNFMCIIFY